MAGGARCFGALVSGRNASPVHGRSSALRVFMTQDLILGLLLFSLYMGP